jgi:PAS domain S-box-containing protein
MKRAKSSRNLERIGGAAAIAQRAADGAMLVDEDGVIRCWNRAAARLMGYRARDVIGRNCHAVMHGVMLNQQPLCSPSCSIGRRLACGHGVRNFEMETHTKRGKTIRLNISSLPIKSKGPHRFLALHLFRDITDQAVILESAANGPRRGKRVGSGTDQTNHQTEIPVIPPLPSAWLPLTRREREILHRLAQGQETFAIADNMCISRNTVRNHIQHILVKLGVHSRLQALATAYRPSA